jgi:DNA-binding LacI/PurR family transcriptional regulator
MKVTHQGIAEKAGCSRAVVTQVLNRSHRVRVSPETRRQVLEIARQLGYEPRNVTTHNIGYLVPAAHIQLDATTAFFEMANRILHAHGYRLILLSFEADSHDEIRQLVTPKAMDGVIFGDWDESLFAHASRKSLPSLLMVDDAELSVAGDQICFDTGETAAIATRYLLGRGHRRMLMIAGTPTSGFSRRLHAGMTQALAEAGLPPENGQLFGTFSKNRNAGDELGDALLQALRGTEPPTAIIAANANGAIVVLNRLQQAGCRVPDDVSLVSLFDSHRLQALRPLISATTAMGETLVAEAIRCLLHRIRHPETMARRFFLPGEIIERHSVMSLMAVI